MFEHATTPIESGPHMTSIIVQHDDSGHWSAWAPDTPEVAFGGPTATAAAARLLDAAGEDAGNWFTDHAHKQADHVEFFRFGATCPDCNGTGRYVGLMTSEDCRTCRGTGTRLL